MLRAYRFWDSFEKNSNCKAWLFKILTNTFINRYQKKKRGREVLNAAFAEQKTTDGVLMQQSSLAQRDPQNILIGNTISDQVIEALYALPADFRLAVVLCDLEGLSYKEIADAMECPIGTVMSRLYRGRRLLKKALRDYAVEEGIIRSGEVDIDSPRKKSSRKASLDDDVSDSTATHTDDDTDDELTEFDEKQNKSLIQLSDYREANEREAKKRQAGESN